jgi:acylphosphatase
MENARAHLFIEGRVQGVFFRAFTREIATRFGLGGWVKNLYDGRVEAVFEGNRDIIEQAIAECQKGPPGSYVTNIDSVWEEHTGAFRGFQIKY